MKSKLLSLLFCLVFINTYSQRKRIFLVPEKPSLAPDYFYTWNIQGYVTDYSSSPIMREVMTEKSIFGTSKYGGWANMFSRLHKDLFLVLDDDWETPLNGNKSFYGSLQQVKAINLNPAWSFSFNDNICHKNKNHIQAE